MVLSLWIGLKESKLARQTNTGGSVTKLFVTNPPSTLKPEQFSDVLVFDFKEHNLVLK